MLKSRKYLSIAIVGAALAVAASAPASAKWPDSPHPSFRHCKVEYEALHEWVWKKFGVLAPHPVTLRNWRNRGYDVASMPDPGQRRIAAYGGGYGYGRAYARMY
jgi:hypothetical protein